MQSLADVFLPTSTASTVTCIGGSSGGGVLSGAQRWAAETRDYLCVCVRARVGGSLQGHLLAEPDPPRCVSAPMHSATPKPLRLCLTAPAHPSSSPPLSLPQPAAAQWMRAPLASARRTPSRSCEVRLAGVVVGKRVGCGVVAGGEGGRLRRVMAAGQERSELLEVAPLLPNH